MAIHEKHYSSQATPNTVSADKTPDERSFVGVVAQSGKPALDCEFNLEQDIQQRLRELIRQRTMPSGFIKGQTRKNGYEDYSFDAPGDPGFTEDAFHLTKQIVCVAGFPLVIEYTNTSTVGDNLIQLDSAPALGGPAPDVKRTDFVFLEAWFSLVAPSPRAQGTIQVASQPSPGDTVTINGNVLTATAGAPGVDEFQIGGSISATTANLRAAINLGSNSFSGDVAASDDGVDLVTLTAQDSGAVGNTVTLASSVPAVLVISAGTLSGGADRPNKPTQDTLYRHGNVLADSSVNLPDDLADPIIVSETAQRVQLQYRIRVTGQTEAVNFKTSPDGFSNSTLTAQGPQSAPVANYPFVPADNSSSMGNSDATTFGIVDPGLWVAGDGSSSSASDLDTLDGRIYAIPICFAFRRNDAYLGGAGAGFDPVNNSNGALPATHGAFVNPAVGPIAANTSDRPDGAFFDAINETDILDLRRHVSAIGHDLASEVEFQMQSLLDGNFQTWAVDTADKQVLGSGSGDVSTRYLVANEIGRGSTVGGNNSTSGDTGRGVTVRSFDHIARRFGAQAVVERAVFGIRPQDREVGPAPAPGIVNPGLYVERAGGVGTDVGWYEGDTIHLDLSALNASTDGTFDPSTASLATILENVLDFAPPGTTITDVLSIRHDDGNYDSAVVQDLQASTIVGLGTGHVAITLDNNPTVVSGGLNLSAIQAQGSIVVAGVPAAGETITIGGVVLTGVAGARTPGSDDFDVTGPTSAIAADIAAAINDGANSFTGTVTASAISSTVILTAVPVGAAGNGITLVTSDAVNFTLSGGSLTGGVDGNPSYPMVGDSGAGDVGSPRRVFVEIEVAYPKGVGLTDTPDLEVVPDATNYDFGPMLENDSSQRPADMEDPLAPAFREGYREVDIEYIASENGGGTPIGGITTEQFVSNSPTQMEFLRRVFGSGSLVVGVTDAVALSPVPVDTTSTEYGSSSRLVNLGGSLSGAGQTLATVTYFSQDAIPNYGAVGGGYQVTTYYRSNAPQTVGVKGGSIHGTVDSLPTTLVVEPLLMDRNVWSGQTSVGSVDLPFPYAVPLDQIPVNDNFSGSFPGEWYFCASAQISIADFNAAVGLLSLQALVPADGTNAFSFGGGANPPRVDAEFRAFYDFADDTAYRPTVMAQGLSGAVRHKVFMPFLARATQETRLFREGEVLLVVLSRFAELDADNTIRFTDTDNRTCAGIYRTRNLLLTIGEQV